MAVHVNGMSDCIFAESLIEVKQDHSKILNEVFIMNMFEKLCFYLPEFKSDLDHFFEKEYHQPFGIERTSYGDLV